MLFRSAARVVLGSVALADREATERLLGSMGERLVVGIEADGAKIVPRGRGARENEVCVQPRSRSRQPEAEQHLAKATTTLLHRAEPTGNGRLRHRLAERAIAVQSRHFLDEIRFAFQIAAESRDFKTQIVLILAGRLQFDSGQQLLDFFGLGRDAKQFFNPAGAQRNHARLRRMRRSNNLHTTFRDFPAAPPGDQRSKVIAHFDGS